MRIPSLVLLALAVLTSMSSVASAQSTCAAGRISLLPLATTTFTDSSKVYTFGFCNSVQTSLSSLTACATSGYVQVHNTANTACLASYSTISTSLTQTTTGAYFVVQTSDGAQQANVSITCDQTATSGTVNLKTPVSSSTSTAGVTTTTFELTSRAGCSISEFFCDDTVSCSDSTKTCMNGVCFDTSCAQVTSVLQQAKLPANYISEVSVQDCHGTPMSSLTSTDFVVTLDGESLTSTALNNEVIRVVEASPEDPVPSFTTLLLDQSASVKDDATVQSTLKTAVNTFITEVTGSSTNHYIAILAFDGGSDVATVVPFSTDATTLRTGVDSGLPPSALVDLGSTDLYMAVINGLDETYRMTFAFGNTSAPVVSSLVVFTDGHDTSRRSTSTAAILKSAQMASKVQIMSVGISGTSDTDFLSAISTSGFFSFVSLSNLAQTFSDAAKKLVALTSNVYYVLMCIPMRKSNIPVTVALNTSTFPVTNTLTYSVDGSNFIGGCTEANLRSEIADALTAAQKQVDQLPAGGTLVETVPAGGAYFFYLTLTSELETIQITPPSLLVLYSQATGGQGCTILSDSCNDGNFTGSFTPSQLNVRYDFMVQNSAALASVVSVSTSASTPAPTPAPTNALGQIISVNSAINYSLPIVDSGIPDLDVEAGIVLGVFTGLFLLLLIVAIYYIRTAQSNAIQVAEKKRRRVRTQPVEQQQQILQAPVYSEIQPYRYEQNVKSNDRSSFGVGLNSQSLKGLDSGNRGIGGGGPYSNKGGASPAFSANYSYNNSGGAGSPYRHSNTSQFPGGGPPTRADMYVPPAGGGGGSPHGGNYSRGGAGGGLSALGEGQSFDAGGRPVYQM